VGLNSDAGNWRKWVLDQADRLDPLEKRPRRFWITSIST